MSISTATLARATGPTLVPESPRSPQAPTTLSVAKSPTDAPDLTIHRLTSTHHGRTLLMLGHAAEYLIQLAPVPASGEGEQFGQRGCPYPDGVQPQRLR